MGGTSRAGLADESFTNKSKKKKRERKGGVRNAGVGLEWKWKCQDSRTAFYALDSEPHGRRLLLLVQKPPDRPRLKPDPDITLFLPLIRNRPARLSYTPATLR